jgi:[protein-PII] uridylyltransferase
VVRLLEELRSLERAYSRGHHGQWSARRRAALVDSCVIELFEAAREGAPRRVALVALGGYGRGELAPASDIDLMVLHAVRNSSAVKEVAERLFYPLWDGGFAVGNAVRTARECAMLASQQVDAATALLDARFLAGDRPLFEAMHDRLLGEVRRDPEAFVRRLRDAGAERRARFGSVSHLLEPDVKEGSGGLRDIHALSWAAWAMAGQGGLRTLEAHGLLRGSERSAVEDAEEFLTRLRSAIHLESATKTGRILIDAQPGIAEAFGFESEPGLQAVDGLMRATFEHARLVEYVTEAVWGRILEPHRLTNGAPSAEDSPATILALFADAAARGGNVDTESLDRIEEAGLPEEFEWSPSVRESFLSILRAGVPGVAALEALDRAGLLVKFLPEWGPVRCRPQRDPYHRFTVDVHLLETVSEAARVCSDPPPDDPVAVRAASALEDRDGLVVGALLHDIGKTGEGGHVAAGTRIAGTVLDRMGLPSRTAELARFLVENHLLLSDTATRRDLEDQDLVLDVAARVGDPERLAALYLLTLADAAATGPHAWTPWRATLVRELMAKVQHVLERGEMGTEAASRLERTADAIRTASSSEDPAEVERFLARMPRAYLLATPADRAAEHFHLIGPPVGAVDVRTIAEPGSRPSTHSLTVVARDRPGLLSRIAGALALSGLSILTAQVFTTEDGVALDVFEVQGAFEGHVDEERWRAFRSTLRRAMEGRLSLEYRVGEKRAYYQKPRADVPVTVMVDNGASDFFTVIEVGAPDRIGLLFDITRTLADLQLDVHLAKVATYGDRVIDAFYVRDVLGRKIEDDEHVREVERAIRARLSE